MSEFALNLIAMLARWRFELLFAFIVGGVAIDIIFSTKSTHSATWFLFFTGIGLINVLLGPTLSADLLHRFGATGAATITGAFPTSTQYNNHNVAGYDVLIQGADGKVTKVSFRDDDFNVYPSHNATTYPGPGDRFNVRYLKDYPASFVILADDDSPWARQLRCAPLQSGVAQANQAYEFNRASPALRRDYLAAIHAALKSPDCEISATERADFTQDIANIQAGRE
jgi:hypothetical protein